MSDTNIFPPFEPGPAPTTLASPAPAEQPASETKKKRTKSKRKVAQVNEPTETAPAEPAKQRKRRTVPNVKLPRSVRLPISTMLNAMSGLKTADAALFEKLIGILNGAGKNQRHRVLAALGKIFS